MLTRVSLEEEQIVLEFDPKNKGKFRIKKLEQDKIVSTYSETVTKENLNNTKWYLEWQISYYIEEYNEQGEEDAKTLLILNKHIKLFRGKKAYPFELKT